MSVRRAPFGWVLLVCAGCTPVQSAWHPAGPQTATWRSLFLLYLPILIVVWALVVAVLAWAVLRRRAPFEGAPPHERPETLDDRPLHRSVGLAAGAAVAVLLVLLVSSFHTAHRMARFGDLPKRVVQITGHQFWWGIRYLDAEPSKTVETANELHIPVGEPVLLQLVAADVIHSFWVPNLSPKKDLIPGQLNTLVLQADRPGTYRGQCAEYCGVQHAHMVIRVIAEPPEAFESWLAAQRHPAVDPGDALARHGRDVFLSGPCVLCHTIRGTPAGSRNGPDLTHLASRTTLAAGLLPMGRAQLAGWVLNAQSLKPGAQMPSISLPADDFHALLAYLEALR